MATPVQLLRSHKSTPTSSAAYAVDAAVRSAADSDLLHAVDSAVGAVFYSAVYGPVYIRTWRAVSEIHLARIGMVDRLLKEAHQQAATRIGDDKHIETQTPEPPEAPEIVAPGKRGEPQPWGFTIALLILGSLFVLAFAQSYPQARKIAANSPTPVPSATPGPLANVPATGKVIEHGGGYWQWDGQEWKPVPRAIPVGRKL